jgi:hypothetical protein
LFDGIFKTLFISFVRVFVLIKKNFKSNIEHIALNGEREIYVCLNLTKISDYCVYKNQVKNNTMHPKYQYPSLKFGY